MNSDAAPPLLHAVVPLAAAGRRFDQVLAELFPDYSRSRLAEWIKSGDALLNGASAKPRQIVRGAESVTLRALQEAQVDVAAEPIALRICLEDRHFWIIDKPAGLVVHPGAGNAAGTLQNALLHLDSQLATLPRAGIVHRLDKETSGLMVVARTLKAHAALVAALEARAVHRQYVAVVNGAMIAGGSVRAPIARHPHDRLKMAVVEGGKPAITHYRVRERFRAHTLAQCNLETGRTHQIRVHMAHLRHPLVGDPLYGGGLKLPKGASPALVAELRGFKRQALHAERLEFSHPDSGATVAVESPWPADLAQLCRVLRADTGTLKPG